MKQSTPLHKEKKTNGMQINIWALSGAIGWRITLPVVIFVIGGIKVDQWLHTLPLFTIASIFLAVATSIILIKRDIRYLSSMNYPKRDKTE